MTMHRPQVSNRASVRGVNPPTNPASPTLLASRAAALDSFDVDTQLEVLLQVPPPRAAALLSRLSAASARRVLDRMDGATVGKLLAYLPLDEVTRLMESASPARLPLFLMSLTPRRAAWVRVALSYPAGSVARILSDAFVQADRGTPAQMALAMLHNPGLVKPLVNDLFVVDVTERLVGVVPYQALVEAPPDMPVGALARPVGHEVITLDTERREVARLATHAGLTVLPVVRESGTLLGVVKANTALDYLAFSSKQARSGGVWRSQRLLMGGLTAVLVATMVLAGLLVFDPPLAFPLM